MDTVVSLMRGIDIYFLFIYKVYCLDNKSHQVFSFPSHLSICSTDVCHLSANGEVCKSFPREELKTEFHHKNFH